MPESKSIRDDMNILAIPYINRYIKNPDEMIKIFNNTVVPLNVMQSLYFHLTSDKSIPVIEEISQEEKKFFWNWVKSLCPGISKERAIELSKAVYTIEFIIKNI